MPWTDVGGFRLHYMLQGDANKPVLVLSNSLGADLSMWDAQVDALLPVVRLLRYDTRGHGQSEMPASITITTLADLASDALALLDALEIRQAHLCGVSLGGLTAMWMGVHAAARVQSLVLSNTAAKIGNTGAWNARIAAITEGGIPAIAESVPSRWFTPSFHPASGAFASAKTMLLGCSVAGYIAASGAIRDADLREDIGAITAPTLVISGEADAVTPRADGLQLQASIPGAIFQQVPGAHLANIEDPLAYNRVLLWFFAQHAGKRGKP